jgi:hypothetical protein
MGVWSSARTWSEPAVCRVEIDARTTSCIETPEGHLTGMQRLPAKAKVGEVADSLWDDVGPAASVRADRKDSEANPKPLPSVVQWIAVNEKVLLRLCVNEEPVEIEDFVD